MYRDFFALVVRTVNVNNYIFQQMGGKVMKITKNWVNVSHSIGVPFGGIGTGYGVLGKYGFVLPNFNSTPCVGKYDDFNRLECYDYLNLHGKDRYNFMSLIIPEWNSRNCYIQ